MIQQQAKHLTTTRELSSPAMTPTIKANVVGILIGDVIKELAETLERTPADWDTFILRKYLADKFAKRVVELSRDQLRKYKRDCVIHAL